MAIQEQHLTIEAFWELAQQSEYEHKQLELFEGALVVMSRSSGRNSEIAGTIYFLIRTYLVDHPIGRLTGADGGYRLADDTLVAPDVGFIQHERTSEEDFSCYPIPPDLAVEVISPSETGPSTHRKARKHLEGGVQGDGHVYPDDQTVDLVTIDESGDIIARTISTDGDINGGTVLPGFAAKISEFFQ